MPGQTEIASQGAYALVALPVPMTGLFTYAVPTELRERIFPGCRVEVPFGRRVLSGIVTEFADETTVAGVKDIRALYETYLPSDMLELTRWIARYYGCSLGEAAQSVLPPLLKRSRRAAPLRGGLRLLSPVDEETLAVVLKRAPKQMDLVRRLVQVPQGADVKEVLAWGFSNAHIKGLVERGIAEQIDSDASPRHSPLADVEEPVEKLTDDQARALTQIDGALSGGEFAPMLLHGVTGSGKTELYIRAARSVVEQGGGCIVLVPEIGLLPQAMERYRRVFGRNIAILHSRMTGPERFEMWKRIESGQCAVVLGPRSAVFSPVRNLRLIVVDEEQDDSYKQDDKPRYHARNVALVRGKIEGATVVLGSATPSAEALHHATMGRYTYLTLPERVTGSALPRIEFVDMRDASPEGDHFSTRLLECLQDVIDAGDQAILFLNKRGHARFVQCNACGWVAQCSNCDISLTYHRVTSRLKCHFCGFTLPAVERCPECRATRLHFAGAGTQRVELDLESHFPGVRILRMDADTTAGKEGHRNVLEKFSTGCYPILVGTQMVAKGHHFPGVRLVGVLFAEESLYFPDFRAAERTYQQLTQVSGRAGRGAKAGEVIVQTYQPEHPVFQYLASHDYAGFMRQELKVREQLRYPPYTRIVLASCASPNREALQRVVTDWSGQVRRRAAASRGRVEVLGPVSPVVGRIKNRYREQLLIKGHLADDEKATLLADFHAIAGKSRGGRGVELRWDVDPESFL